MDRCDAFAAGILSTAQTPRLGNRIGFQFFAQGTSVETQDPCCLALIAPGVFHNDFEERFFYFAQYQLIEITGTIAIQACEILLQGFLGMLAQWFIVV